jgi:hypothetical protein
MAAERTKQAFAEGWRQASGRGTTSHQIESKAIFSVSGSAQIRDLLDKQFAETGATNKELLEAFVSGKLGSRSTFIRGLKAAKEEKLVRVKGQGKGARYFPIGVSVSLVSS